MCVCVVQKKEEQEKKRMGVEVMIDSAVHSHSVRRRDVAATNGEGQVDDFCGRYAPFAAAYTKES